MYKSRFVTALLWSLIAITTSAGFAGIVTDPHTSVPGATILSSDLNARFSTLYALVNGQLDNANLKVGAAINPTKLDLTKEFPILRPLAADRGVSVGVSGDTQARTAIRGDGSVTWGPGGSTVFDTILKRTGVGALSIRNAADSGNADLTVGNLTISGTLSAAGTTIVNPPGCRLTLTSGTPVTSSDVTAAATLYITPYTSNVLPAYQSSDSKYYNRTFSEFSVSLASISSGTNYDVYARYSSGWAGSLVAWTNDTTRATALARSSSSGLLYKSGDEEYLYLGTIRASGSGTCEDSAAKRYVWNMYNRVDRGMVAMDSTASWTYTTATLREWNGASTEGVSRVGMVRGLNEDEVNATVNIYTANTTALVNRNCGIGLDSSTAHAGTIGFMQPNFINGSVPGFASYEGAPGLGYHTLRALEYSGATGTTTWQNFLSGQQQAGLHARGRF